MPSPLPLQLLKSRIPPPSVQLVLLLCSTHSSCSDPNAPLPIFEGLPRMRRHRGGSAWKPKADEPRLQLQGNSEGCHVLDSFRQGEAHSSTERRWQPKQEACQVPAIHRKRAAKIQSLAERRVHSALLGSPQQRALSYGGPSPPDAKQSSGDKHQPFGHSNGSREHETANSHDQERPLCPMLSH